MSNSRRAFSVSAYIQHGNRVLLVNHVKQQAWVPIGGEIEANETPFEALQREVREEVGWTLGTDYVMRDRASTLPSVNITGSPPGLLIYEEHVAGPKGTHMNFAFHLEAMSDAILPCSEFTEHAWVTSPDALSPVPPNVYSIVQYLFWQISG